MDLKTFLLARIAEDEECAHRALPLIDVESPRWKVENLQRRSVMSRSDAEHSARHDPARVLAECAAKRAIVEQASQVNALEGEFTDYMWRGAEPEMNTPKLGDQMLRTLAAVYADHPDYQQEWKL